MYKQIEINADLQGSPHWIRVNLLVQGAISMRVDEAERLLLELKQAIEFVKKKEELEHHASLVSVYRFEDWRRKND